MALFTAAVFGAAVLLFWIQPLFTKMVLPLLGGSPAVWNTAMVFFQGALLSGYGYAHLLARWLPPRHQFLIHLGVLSAAALFLPVVASQSWQPQPDTHPTVWLLTLLTASLGLPFLAIAATAPLVQRWFSQTNHSRAADPYFLYAASNVGSVAVLLAFPFVLEPLLSTGAQALLWSAGFGVFACVIVGCGLWAWWQPNIPSPAPTDSSARPSGWHARAGWVVYSAVPSSLLLGVTGHISTDIASAPLLWIVPLVLYLLSFVNAFARRPVIPHAIAVRAMALALVTIAIVFQWREPAGIFLPLHLLAFFALALGCHGELARRRPVAADLTEFYLFLSLGGLLGGALVAIVAPLLLDRLLEYPVGLVLAAALLPKGTRTITRGDLTLALGAGVVVLAVPLSREWFGWSLPPAIVACTLALLAVFVLSRQVRPPAFALCIAVLLFAAMPFAMGDRTVWTGRSFFGVYRVTETDSPASRSLVHGTTDHGGQWMPDGGEIRPTAYYTAASPVAQVLRKTQGATPGQRVGMVGLGSGAMAYYRRPGEEWTFFEIDPLVKWLATGSGFFELMSRHAPQAPVVLGDARLTIARQPDGFFDLLIVDAFSSDAIPIHLLTREAIALYVEKLASEGMLVMHISNRFLDLEPVIVGAVAEFGYAARRSRGKQSDEAANPTGTPSDWIAVARDGALLASLGETWLPVDRSRQLVWRDDHSSLTSIIRWRGGQSSDPPETQRDESAGGLGAPNRP